MLVDSSTPTNSRTPVKPRAQRWNPLVIGIMLAYLLLPLSLPLVAMAFTYPKQQLQLPGTPLDTTNASKPIDRSTVPYLESFTKISYTVQPGDSIDIIASRKKIDASTIIELNNLADAFIRPGEKLILPNINGVFHRVNPGESLLQLVAKYQISFARIADVNQLSSSDLNVGQLLFIPKNDYQNIAVAAEKFSPPLAGSNGGSSLAPPANDDDNSTELLLPGNYGDSVAAIYDGTIEVVSHHPKIAKYLVLRLTNNLIVVYGHLAAVNITSGQRVAKGQLLASIGRGVLVDKPTLYLLVFENNNALPLTNYPEDLHNIMINLAASPAEFGLATKLVH